MSGLGMPSSVAVARLNVETIGLPSDTGGRYIQGYRFYDSGQSLLSDCLDCGQTDHVFVNLLRWDKEVQVSLSFLLLVLRVFRLMPPLPLHRGCSMLRLGRIESEDLHQRLKGGSDGLFHTIMMTKLRFLSQLAAQMKRILEVIPTKFHGKIGTPTSNIYRASLRCPSICEWKMAVWNHLLRCKIHISCTINRSEQRVAGPEITSPTTPCMHTKEAPFHACELDIKL